MISLGIEGTAHTLGIGIIDDEDNVLANVNKTYVPEEGGIHPREASWFMAEVFGDAINEGIEKAGLSRKDIDLVSFSQGPGLAPCLQNTAVGARALSLSLDKPLIGVNHCVAHIEVGNMVARKEFPDWAQPLTLYVSGANTQIIMFREGRYRVFGETLDIGTGNMLDKFGRAVGLQHPAGPKIEQLAAKGKNFIDLPYIIKGNDISLSGLLTEAIKRTNDHSLEDICYSLQEITFSMLTEATERALCHLKSDSLLLTGGVANNKRLQEMVKIMADDNKVNFSVPKGLCGDNGAMIAWTGLVMHQNGVKQTLKETDRNPNFRTDQVDIIWTRKGHSMAKLPEGMWKGAEATLRRDGEKLEKKRIKKTYRLDEIDESIRKSRTRKEPRLLRRVRELGIGTPEIINVSEEECKFTMGFLDGPAVYELIDDKPELATEVGEIVLLMHKHDFIHGDLTTSNMIYHDGRIHLIDFGLGNVSRKVEDKATDLLLFKKSLNANHSKNFEKLWANVLKGYTNKENLERLEIAEKRGRYL